MEQHYNIGEYYNNGGIETTNEMVTDYSLNQ